ncbi:MAG: hypothetical protein K2Y51_08765 [Gammaproteobacteria bacterium]|jgi:hypothetical protein|nr:hypothetical protein [Gammaproteobacteria bacterium]
MSRQSPVPFCSDYARPGVSFEDRLDLLGHRAGRITTHCPAAERSHLIEAANSVCDRQGVRQDLVVLRQLRLS